MEAFTSVGVEALLDLQERFGDVDFTEKRLLINIVKKVLDVDGEWLVIMMENISHQILITLQ